LYLVRVRWCSTAVTWTLLDLVAQRRIEPIHLLPTELIVRASTGPPPGMT